MEDAIRLRERCEALPEADLVRNLTLARDDNSAAFAAEAQRELERRGTTLAAWLDRVTVQAGPTASRTTDIATAVAALHDGVPRRAVATFTHSLGETLVLQREGWGWVLHAYVDERYGRSWLVDDTDRARHLLQRFLSLEPWRDDAGAGHHLDDWKVLVADDAADAMLAVSDRLHAAAVPHIVRPTLFTPPGDNTIAVLVPPDGQRAAESVLQAGRSTATVLRRRAEQVHNGGDAALELAVYDELLEVDDDNHAVHYNRGSLLLELGRRQEAAAAFMEAAARGLARIRPDLSMRGGPTSGGLLGLFGVGLRLLGRAARPNAGPGYPDWLDDVELQLLALLESLGESTELLHSLASLARFKGNTADAVERYRRVLALDPADEVAAFQFQYLLDAGD